MGGEAAGRVGDRRVGKTVRRLATLCIGVLFACSRPQAPPDTSASSSSSAAAKAPTPARIREIRDAELQRDSSRIAATDLSDRDVTVRRRAAQALARIADRRSAELLASAIADEDPDVVAWAAYGLGFACPIEAERAVRAVSARAATWVWSQSRSEHRLNVELAFADSLARCGTRDAEITLRSWLGAPHSLAEAAATALGVLAARRGRLDDASLVALLDAADQQDKSLDNALLAFGHLDRLADSVRDRMMGVATKALKRKGDGRRFALRALGLGGPKAAATLQRVLEDGGAPAAERAEAARQLARLGEAGQPALAAALGKIAPKQVGKNANLVSPAFAPLAATLESLVDARHDARESLTQLAELTIPTGASPATRRRVVWLRCRAASLLAGNASLSARLLACDPEEGRLGQLAMVEVLGRGRLERARYRRWKSLATSDDILVRQAALRLMATHPEIAAPHEILTAALRSPADGVVATAAQILASFPDRAGERDAEERAVEGGPITEGEAIAPHPQIVAALTEALAKKTAPDALQRQAALIDAVGALQILSFKPQLREACESEYPVLRERAERALRLLGERRKECRQTKPRHVGSLSETTAAKRLVLQTDAGPLAIELETEFSPQAAARVVKLARAGFYDGTTVHRVVPGFVVQFGDRDGDGFGGAGQQPLPCETAPVPFTERSVGMAISGRDTGSSQLFVTLGPYPHLDGDFTRIGTATGPWDQLVAGDVLRKVTVSPP